MNSSPQPTPERPEAQDPDTLHTESLPSAERQTHHAPDSLRSNIRLMLDGATVRYEEGFRQFQSEQANVIVKMQPDFRLDRWQMWLRFSGAGRGRSLEGVQTALLVTETEEHTPSGIAVCDLGLVMTVASLERDRLYQLSVPLRQVRTLQQLSLYDDCECTPESDGTFRFRADGIDVSFDRNSREVLVRDVLNVESRNQFRLVLHDGSGRIAFSEVKKGKGEIQFKIPPDVTSSFELFVFAEEA